MVISNHMLMAVDKICRLWFQYLILKECLGSLE